MDRSRSERKPTFFWQGVLIILPVIALAIVGFASLRQDKRLAEEEARDLGASMARRLAQTIADGAGRQLADYHNFNAELHARREASLGLGEWSGNSDRESVEQHLQTWKQANPDIDLSAMPLSDGLVSTRPGNTRNLALIQEYPLAPQPPEWVGQLAPAQAQLWQEAAKAEFGLADWAAAQSAIEKFIATELPIGARANAEYRLLCLKTQTLPASEAARQFAESDLARSDQLTETGLPVGQLVCYHALRLMADHAGLPDKFLHALAWSIAYRPSIFSPRLIAEAQRVDELASPKSESRAATLKAWWDSADETRRAVRNFREQYAISQWTNTLFWVKQPDDDFLLVLPDARPEPSSSSTNYHLLLFPKAVVLKAIDEAVVKADLSIPPYAIATMEIGGRELALRGQTISPAVEASSPVLLGEAVTRLSVLSAQSVPFRVRLLLAKADILYARQRQRALMFGSLIAVAAVAALIGFFAARRAFHRQLHLSEMKSNFVSSVSHELRAPIASVRLMAEGLERGKVQDPKKQNEYFRFIVQECRRLSSLIENVLDFSRIEQGRKQYEFEPTDAVALVQQTVKLMETYAAEQQVKLVLQITGDPFPFEMDGKAMQQALINLLDNAIKHSPKGSAISIGLEFEQSTVCSVLRFWVEDRGEGIPQAEHEKIFERFYRLGSELRRETQGVGIGLSIVQHIVQAHAGTIQVRSAPGEGSRFTIELPLKRNQP